MGFRSNHLLQLTTTPKMKTFIAFASLVSAVFAAGPPPPYHPAPAYGKGPVYADTPPVYGYEYGVQDEYSGVNFGQNEKRDGYSTSGQYRVLLPDGRTQIVTYHTADAYSGNVAEVVYEGTPHYGPAPKPVHKPIPVHPGPVYKPAPIHPIHG